MRRFIENFFVAAFAALVVAAAGAFLWFVTRLVPCCFF